jgi:hypothetical protein
MANETRECLTPLADTSHGRPVRREGGAASGLTLSQAEGLLDWLEAGGCTGLRAYLLGGGGVTVFWSGATRPAKA